MDFQPGLTGEVRVFVKPQDTAREMGSGSVAVLATPRLIALLEAAAIKALEPHLPPGTTTVGIQVDCRHLAATPVGMEVTARAYLEKVEGKKYTFQVDARDEVDLIAKGTHCRYQVEAVSFLKKAEGKK